MHTYGAPRNTSAILKIPGTRRPCPCCDRKWGRSFKKSARQAAKKEIQQETIIPVDLIPLFDIIEEWGL